MAASCILLHRFGLLSKPLASWLPLQTNGLSSASTLASIASASCSWANSQLRLGFSELRLLFCASKSSASALRWCSDQFSFGCLLTIFFQLRLAYGCWQSNLLTNLNWRSLTSASFLFHDIGFSRALFTTLYFCPQSLLAASAFAWAISAFAWGMLVWVFNSFCFCAISRSAQTRFVVGQFILFASTSPCVRVLLGFGNQGIFLNGFNTFNPEVVS